MHVVPDVDDGSRGIDESCEMLRMAAGQGVDTVFATPHGTAFLCTDVRASFRLLREAVLERKIPVDLRLGCEMRIYADTARQCVRQLNDGTLPTMGGSRCVLTEFTFETKREEYRLCIDTLVENGYTPIIAHIERYPPMNVVLARELKEKGAMIQINAYSIAEERNPRIRSIANTLLRERLVDFIGSDAHRTDHRPPLLKRGMETFRQQYGETYADLVVFENPRKYLL